MLSSLDNLKQIPLLLSSVVSRFNDFSTFLHSLLTNFNSINFKRSRKLNASLLFYIMSQVNGSNDGYATILNNCKIDNIVNITEQSVNEKLHQIDSSNFLIVNDKLNEYIFNGNNKKRFLAVDGTRIHLFEKLKKDNIPISQNGACCTALISGLIDIETNIPLNYNLYCSNNEREAFREQLKYINKDTDTLIFDRGYYSDELYNELLEKEINIIFRLKSTYLFVRKFIESNKNDDVVTITTGKKTKEIKLVKYIQNNETYILGTSNKDFTLDMLKEIYHKRWQIETQFNYLKSVLSLENISSKSLNRIRQDIYIHQFIMIITNYIQTLIYEKINYTTENKINTTNTIKMVYIHILKLLLCTDRLNENYCNELLKIIHTIATSITPVRKNRQYDRVSKKPHKKFTVTDPKVAREKWKKNKEIRKKDQNLNKIYNVNDKNETTTKINKIETNIEQPKINTELEVRKTKLTHFSLKKYYTNSKKPNDKYFTLSF